MAETELVRSIQFIDRYYPYIDGVVQTVHNYALNMNATVVCPHMTRHFDVSDLPYHVLVCPAIRVPRIKSAAAVPVLDRSLMKEIRSENPEILHAHSPALLGKFALRAGHRLGIPVIGTFHSKVYDATLEFTGSKMLAREVTRETVEFYEACDEVWACSEGTAETLCSYGYHGDITVMTNGTGLVYPANPNVLRAATAEKLNLPRGKRLLLFVGQMEWYKNQRLILDAYRLLTKDSDAYCLVFAGEGKEEGEIRKYAASLGLADSVIFTGKISDQELLSGLYLNADLFFFPSVFDNTPLVLREAAALGVPSLVTEGPNAAESIRKDENGFTAPAEASAMCAEIQRIFAHPELLKAAGEGASETIPVTWTKLIPKVQARYREVIAAYAEKTGSVPRVTAKEETQISEGSSL